jgi:hypothetical protein
LTRDLEDVEQVIFIFITKDFCRKVVGTMTTGGGACFAFGVILIGTSLLNPDFFFLGNRTRGFVKLLGRFGARVLFGVVGAALMCYGFFFLRQ